MSSRSAVFAADSGRRERPAPARVSLASGSGLVFALALFCAGACDSTKDNPVLTQNDAGDANSVGEATAGRTATGSAGASTPAQRDGGAGASGASSAAASGGTGVAGRGPRPAGAAGSAADGGRTGAAGAAGAGTGSSGSGGGSGDAGSGGDVRVQQIADSLASAVCASLEACLGAQKLSAVLVRESCPVRISGSLAQDDLAGLPASIAAGRIELQSDMLEQCYSDTRALGCQVQTDRLPESCQRAIAGQVAVGGACNIGSDCAGDAFCGATECPRTCTARAANGGSCRRDEECQGGLFCNAGSCAAPAALGAACNGSSGGVCAFGASCVGSTDVKAGTCKANSEIQLGAVGAVCMPGGVLCREGLSCAFDGADGFSCQAAVAADAACHLALPSQCPIDQYCDAADVTTPGSCVALPTEGAACVLTDECAPRHICVLENDKPICRRIGDLDESCVADGLCRSDHCQGGRCSLRPACL